MKKLHPVDMLFGILAVFFVLFLWMLYRTLNM
jgi:hypothetical protein